MSWNDDFAAAEQAVADYFDEVALSLQPMKVGLTVNHPAGSDPDRDQFDFLGSIDLEPPSDRIARHLSSDTGIRNGTVSYDAVLTAHIGAWPYIPKRGDFVSAPGQLWKIEAKEEDGGLRPAWYLSRVKT